MDEPRTGRARPMSRDERRAAIALATVPLLEAHGAQVSTRQIAVAAGVAEGTLFRAFDDKVELLTAAAERALDPAAGVAEIDDLPRAADLAAELTQLADVMAARGRRVRRVMFAVHAILASDEGRRAAAVRGARGADPLGRPIAGPARAGADAAHADDAAHAPGHRPGDRLPLHGPSGRDARLRALAEVRAAVVRRVEAYRGELRIEPERLAHLLIAAVMGQGPPVLPDDDGVPVTELVDVLLHGAART
ncbi:TetR/AcrR family transcriptional regulator [Cellulomonas sp. PS-H5]|uniref:TetR/AcrR family transcriptional regulator n=1 Tax=Cellulomonas sp. PS-H5 TaxID=2820400 RepID=UPI001C4FBB48|nr:TetR/AcrR family transcriptional regulator [Cellulomonas sp. PS-H5]MBW0253191.1 TetR/AcrR family transcriptional regulator [Cellulomonas sp. PS-H5]